MNKFIVGAVIGGALAYFGHMAIVKQCKIVKAAAATE